MVTEVVDVAYLRWIPLAPAIASGLLAIWVAVLRRDLPRPAVVFFGCVPLLVSLTVTGFAFAKLVKIEGGGVLIDDFYTWIGAGVASGAFSANFALHFDPLSAVMCLLVIGVGFLVHLYSVAYMDADQRADRGTERFFCYLSLAVSAMLVLVLADNLLLLFLGWQGLGVGSYLLVGFWYTDRRNAYAGAKAFVINRLGDSAFLVGILLLFRSLSEAGVPTLTLRGIEANFALIQDQVFVLPKILPESILALTGTEWPIPTTLAVLFLIGVFAKSAQFPFHVWLPDEVASPTPVSAVMQTILMVAAGVYFVCRFSFLYAASPELGQWLAWVGGATAFIGAFAAIFQSDIKKVLAYSTLSQVGFVFLALGCGAYGLAIFHLLSHALAKAALFLGVGIVLLALNHERDLWRMGGLRKGMARTHVLMLLACLTLAGAPPFSIFFSRDQILIATSAADGVAGHQWLYWLAVVSAGLTAFYITRLLILVFWGLPRAVPNFRSRIDDPNRWLILPFAALTLIAMTAGLLTPPQFWGDFIIPGESSDSLGNFLVGVLAPSAPHGLDRSEEWQVVRWGGVASLVGAVSAWFLYRYQLDFTHRISEMLVAPARWVRGGFAFDDLYSWSFVRPTVAVSGAVAERGVERLLFERIVVGGSEMLVRGIAELSRRTIQSGVIGMYFATIALGAVLMAIYFVWGAGSSSPGTGGTN